MQDPGQAQPEDDEGRTTDDAEERQDIDQALSKVRRGQPEQREDRGEPDDERDRVADGEPSAGPGQPAARDGDRAQLTEVCRDKRQHAR